MVNETPTLADVLAARELLRGRVFETPVLRVPSLDATAGAALYLKAENLQRIGAFKARGALVAALRIPADDRAKGLVTFSSGNHGQAVALAARELGVPAYIAMPEDAPRVKVDAVRELGAQITFAGTTSDDRRVAALAIQERTGAFLIPPFDHADVILGQGTATLELCERAALDGAPLDAVVVPVGGGGLLAGACLACAGTGTRVIAVEPEAADALARSLAAGERVSVTPGATIADGLKPTQIGALNFAIAKAHVAQALTVDDDAIGSATVRLLLEGKVLAEPSGATALAGALSGRLDGAPKRVGVIVSGGNVAPDRLAALLARHA